jgi:site-specific recombinase XerD
MDEILSLPTAEPLARAGRDPYFEAALTWWEGYPENTRRSYRSALEAFFAFTGKRPNQVTPLDVARWKEHLKSQGRADSTIAQRLSALSSYYTYLQQPQADGRPLHDHNPVKGVGRDDLTVSPYERARKLNLGNFRRILAEIDVDTVTGARDRALFLFYVFCARRRSEVVNLRGRDLRQDGERVTYRARLKRGKVSWKEVPPPVWEAICHYLKLAGRTLADDTPVFVATVDRGQSLRRHYNRVRAREGKPPLPDPRGPTPLTGQAVLDALKRYARRAGLDPDKVNLHSLRHLGAELFYEASGDLHETQAFLDHEHLDTTQIYLRQLTGEEHRHWQEMADMLGLKGESP